MTKYLTYRLTEEEVDFLDLALHWMELDLDREKNAGVHHLDRALAAAQQAVMVAQVAERLRNPDKEEEA